MAAAHHMTALGFYADGLELDRRLAELMPDSPGVLYNLACSLALTNRQEEALEILAKAIKAGYGDHVHMRRDSDLDALRPYPLFHALLAMAEKSAGKELEP